MEARVARNQLLLVLALVVALRLPFLNQAVQGDDDIYLTVAAHALVDPLHPTSTSYVFRGVPVDLRGQPHPPLDGWVLAGLIALFGDVKEIPFHAFYMVFSLIAAAAMWSLARRFSPQPLWAALLFIAVPAFVVNGNSFETDLPFLAFWMAAVALFVGSHPLWSVVPMALAAMTSYQTVFLIPILAVYCWLFCRRDVVRWAATLTPAVVAGGWQLFERLSTGALPAEVLGGYLAEYQGLSTKLANAAMLFIHSWWIVFPVLSVGAVVVAWRNRRSPDVQFLLAWIGIFFACGAVIFPAGAARYLLPMAAPVVLLAARLPRRWLAAGFAAQLALSLGLAVVNYQHWDGVRRFAGRVHAAAPDARLWVNGEHGLRFYCEQEGALPLTRSQTVRPGDIIVTSELSRSFEPMAPTVPLLAAVIRPAIPLRLIGLESHSGYSTVQKGFWPFGISAGAIDRLTAVKVVERQPTLSYLPMNAPEAPEQIVSGIYDLEDHHFRWMARTAALVLKSPTAALPLRVEFSIPANAPGRRVTVRMDGREVASETYPAPGAYTLSTPPLQAAGASAAIQIEVDRAFSVPGDRRELGIVLTGVGFR
ncbi:MAG TPA: hypothetical protein VME43_07440 [Bryobacteraceae bacterium]|nr:hypothetical protein [Bryobacteraceae bacterium]